MSDALNHLNVRNFRPGSILFREGDLTTSFYIIHSGEVEIFIQKPNGERQVLGKASAGEPIGEFAFILKSARTATAEALTPVEAFEVSEEGYNKLINDLPDWAQSFIESLVKRLSTANQRLKT